MSKNSMRKIRHKRVRKKVFGTTARPRLSLHLSGRHITVQVIDDTEHTTLVSAHTTEEALRKVTGGRANVAAAEHIGKVIAERGLKKSIRQVVFDRGGYRFHGKVKALADAARQAGLEF